MSTLRRGNAGAPLRRVLIRLGALAFLASCIGGAMVLLASAPGNRLLARQIERVGQGALVGGRFAVGAVDTVGLRQVTFRDLRIDDASGRTVVSIDQLSADWYPAQLMDGRVALGAVEGTGIEMNLTLLPDGGIDLLALFGGAPGEPSSRPAPFSGLGFDLSVGAIVLDDCSVRMNGEGGSRVLSLAGHLRGSLRTVGSNAWLDGIVIDSMVEAPVALPVRVTGALGLVAGALEVSEIYMETDHSSVLVDGAIARVETAPALGLDVLARPVGAADVEALAGTPIFRRDIPLVGRLYGGLDTPRLEAEIGGGESGSVSLSARAGVAAEPVSWSLEATTNDFGLDTVLLGVGAPTRLQGVYRVDGVGTDWPTGLDAAFRVDGGSQVFWGEPLDGLQLEGRMEGGVLRVDVLEGRHAAGTAEASGAVDLLARTAAMQVDARVPSVSRLAEYGAPPAAGSARFFGPVDVSWGDAMPFVKANGRLEASGLSVSGYDIGAMRGPVSLDVHDDVLALEGAVTLDTFRSGSVEAGRADIELDVAWDPQAGMTGAMDAAAEDVSVASGAVWIGDVAGTVTGGMTPDRVATASAEFSVADMLLGPAGTEAEGGSLGVVITGDTVAVELDLSQDARPLVAGRVVGNVGLHEWTAEDLVIAPIADERFEADEPFRFTLADGGVRGLRGRFSSGSGAVTIEGDLLPRGAGRSDLDVQIEGLDLASFARIHDAYAAPTPALRLDGVQGTVELRLQLTGNDSHATELLLVMDGLSLPPAAGPAVNDLDLEFSVRGDLDRPAVAMRAAHDGSLLVDARGEVPLVWRNGVPTLDCGAIAALDALLAPGPIARLHERLPDIPAVDALGSASLAARGSLCDPDVQLVSTWSISAGPQGERVQIEFDADRVGAAVEVRGALDDSLARQLTVHGEATSPAADTFRALLAGQDAVDVARLDSWLGEVDLHVTPHGVPLARISQLAGLDASLHGRLLGGLSVAGPVMRPSLSGELYVDGGRIGPVPVSEAFVGLRADDGGGYRVDGRVGFGTNEQLGSLGFEGDVPVLFDLGADPGVLWGRRGLAVRVDGGGIPLSVLEGFSPDIESTAGQLTVGGFISGSLLDPLANFVVGIRDGQIVHRGLGVRYSDMELDLRANGHHLQLAQFSLLTSERESRRVGGRVLGSSPGRLRAVGSALLGQGGLEEVDLEVDAEGFWVSNHAKARLRTDGELHVSGDWPTLSIAGDLELLEGMLTLDERVFMDGGDLALDPRITVIRPRGRGGKVAESDESALTDLHLDLHLDLHRGLRLLAAVPMDDTMGGELTALSTVRMDADLASPDLRVLTKSGELVLNGRVEVPRGQLTLLGTTFEMSAAADNALNFISDDYLEPSLDITAEKATRAYGTVEAHVTGSPSTPMVRFENALHPEETDIMSILLFGKPAAELSDSEGQTRAGMLSAAIGMMARNSLNLALGGGTLRTEIDFDEDSFRVGRPLSDRVFASFEVLAQTEQDDGTFEVTLEWLISRRLYAEVAGGDGGNSADLFWRWRF